MSLDNIKSRGHWIIKIRPVDFVEKRVDRISVLEQSLFASAVNLRGWDFPHIDHRGQNIVRTAQYLQQDFDWNLFKEFWRFSLSGQFIFYGSLWGEWRDQYPGNFGPLDNSRNPVLIVHDVVGKWTETLLFASKLMTRIHVENVEIEISLVGLQGRSLYILSANRMPFVQPRVAQIPSYDWSSRYEVTDLSTRFKGYAVRECLNLFDTFGWDATEEIVTSIQNEVFRNSTI